MRILDDLLTCEMRAYLSHLAKREKTLTPSEEYGRKEHEKAVARDIKRIMGRVRHAYLILAEHAESPVRFSTARGSKVLVFSGRPDYVALVTDRQATITVNVEVSDYTSALKSVKLRQVLYAVALYEKYGFPVLPLHYLANEKRLYVLVKPNCWDRWVEGKLGRLVEILTEADEPKPPFSTSLCISCEPRYKSKCHYRPF